MKKQREWRAWATFRLVMATPLHRCLCQRFRHCRCQHPPQGHRLALEEPNSTAFDDQEPGIAAPLLLCHTLLLYQQKSPSQVRRREARFLAPGKGLARPQFLGV